ncbi:MAG: UDP-4-amino-4,6-dideoxy-N-acetyl-beta-L-altrosamine N-acetyltransferase [Pseudomonadota bacterium]
MKLRFRNIHETDLKMILDWRTMPEVSAYMYTDFQPDMERQRQWFRTISRDPCRVDWIIRADGEDLGVVGISNIDATNRRAAWAYYLGSPNTRGKGIGKAVELNVLNYVFTVLNLNKLCCEVFVSNDKVIKIHEKLGSRIEGTRREQVFKNGRFHDIVEMGILRSDWEQGIRNQVEFVQGEFETPEKEVARVVDHV